MKYEFTEVRDSGVWDDFVANSPQGSVFSRTHFLEAHGTEFRTVGVTAEGVLLLGAPLLLREGRILQAPNPLTMYQGPMLARQVCELPVHRRTSQVLALCDALLGGLEATCERISFCVHHRFPDLRSFSWFHYHERDKGLFSMELRYTGLLDLARTADWAAYLGDLRDVRRQEYRKALSSGWIVEPSRDLDLLDHLHHQTFARQGLEQEEDVSQCVRAVASAALAHNFGEMLVCRNPNGAVAGATFFLHDPECGYYWVGANDPEFRKTGSGTLLLAESIRRCRERGAKSVDMVGINSPNRGDFKTSFNAVPTPYWLATWAR
jgi:GNAT superfamily N-acetyltransferase